MQDPMPNPSAAREPRAIRLSEIGGVSPLNPRAADFEDLESLAASILASGQLQPLIVTYDEDLARVGPYSLLDGQRRWRAMQLLVEQAHWTADHLIDVDVATGEEAELREITLAANTLRRQLHPVEEYEAFAAMAVAGFGEERIARDFGLGLRHVKQRLALGRLSPKIRAAWREGKINADAAQAYTAGATHEAQDAVFDMLGHCQAPNLIKPKLRSDTLSEFSAEARYVGETDYLAAAGRLEEELFDDGANYLDGAILKRLAREKLMAEAEVIAEREGWGFVVHFHEKGDGEFEIEDWEIRYTDDEQAQIETLENSDNEQNEAAMAEIKTKALLRQIPQAARASLGIVANLNPSGAPCFERGWREAQAYQTSSDSPHAGGGVTGKGAAAASSPAAAPDLSAPKTNWPLRFVLDAALDTAFGACVMSRPDLALMLAVARLGISYGSGVSDRIKLSRNYPQRTVESPLLQTISGSAFDEALAICANAPLADLSSAFAEIVARSISVANPRNYDKSPVSDLAPIAKALAARGAPLRERLEEALDRKAYFDAASKQACLDAAKELGTAGATGKKGLIASAVAADATKQKWLPSPLAEWATLPASLLEAHDPEEGSRSGASNPHPEEAAKAAVSKDNPKKGSRSRISKTAPSLAQAMAEAIDADEEARRNKIMRVCEFQGGAPQFAKFMIEHVQFADGLVCKASDLRATCIAICSEVTRHLTATEIGAMMSELGVASKRKKDGVYYLGVGLKNEANNEEAA